MNEQDAYDDGYYDEDEDGLSLARLHAAAHFKCARCGRRGASAGEPARRRASSPSAHSPDQRAPRRCDPEPACGECTPRLLRAHVAAGHSPDMDYPDSVDTAPPALRLAPQKLDHGYRLSFDVAGEDLGARHRDIYAAVQDIPGFLTEEDALKLYELAFFSEGPILEIGTWCGKSLAVLASAVRDSGRTTHIISVDINERKLRQAQEELARRELTANITLIHGSVGALLRVTHDLRPLLVFVDGDHSFRGVRRDLRALEPHMPIGSMLLFHDYTSPRNENPLDPFYDVARAVRRSWVARDCDFGGVFGLSGLFLRRTGAPTPQRPRPLLVEAVRYDKAALRLKQNVPVRLREKVSSRMQRAARRLGR